MSLTPSFLRPSAPLNEILRDHRGAAPGQAPIGCSPRPAPVTLAAARFHLCRKMGPGSLIQRAWRRRSPISSVRSRTSVGTWPLLRRYRGVVFVAAPSRRLGSIPLDHPSLLAGRSARFFSEFMTQPPSSAVDMECVLAFARRAPGWNRRRSCHRRCNAPSPTTAAYFALAVAHTLAARAPLPPPVHMNAYEVRPLVRASPAAFVPRSCGPLVRLAGRRAQ